MKNWELTCLDWTYLKYESKFNSPLLPKNAITSIFRATFPGIQLVYTTIFYTYGIRKTKFVVSIEDSLNLDVSWLFLTYYEIDLV